MLKKFLIVSVLCLLCVSCEEDEADRLASAQNCLDNVSSSNPSAAAECMSYIGDLNTSQANIIKCSIKFLVGGLTTEKISNAYKQLKDDSVTDKEAFYISMLALNPASAATEAATYCTNSGVKGLIYLANLSVMGSLMMDAIGFDPNAGTPNATDIQNALAACQASGCDDAAIGGAVIAVANSYCANTSSSSDICTQVNSAIAAGGGDPATIAQQIYTLLDH